MTYFVDQLPARRSRDLFEFESSATEAAGAALRQSFEESPVRSLFRMGALDRAERGAPIYQPGSQGTEIGRREPETPRLTAEQARARVAEAGLSLTIPDDGIQEGALDIIMERKREELKRQAILAAAPRESVPLQILAGFVGQAMDPINIAASFIPVVGQARYAAMLARAGGTAGRFGVRAGVGAVEGAVGAAIVEPLVLAAAAQDQADYDMTDSLLNVAFGTVLGGGLHSIGGAVADAFKARAVAPAAPVPERAAADTAVLAETPVTARQLLADDPGEAIQALMLRQMREDVQATAVIRAADELTPTIRAELEEIARGKLPDVRDIKAMESSLQQQLDGLDDTFAARAKAFQQEGLSRKEAERAARDAIAEDRLSLQTQRDEARASLEQNRAAELARADLSRLSKGEIPERYQAQIQEHASAIRAGVQQKPLAAAIRLSARDVASAAPFAVREAALKTAVGQAMSGRPIDVEDLFRLKSEPGQAIASIRQKAAQRPLDAEAEATSLKADEMLKSVKDDLAELEEALAGDADLAREFAEQTGLNFDDELKLADELAKNAQAYGKAWRAAAICSMGN